ncbi:conserved protein of unknown function [Magnetospirillum gryphiswaldense MSR-1 v2]|uniref:Phage tail collar domain-containing protein n=1 Tax=Magnetospirillum gryphiswaldense (strain DSM 6361 / JCM 21280 / NBRC 15271 / MSR-1) TaxID=431944 RepID=V6F4L4_MAGGM|nr:tail fiber protein [Magnetospirillum gryphiswaldense]CDL00460.1 conserved protein of unknown function [Magnetospirillum gryphiswaldense MSR-1 v2]
MKTLASPALRRRLCTSAALAMLTFATPSWACGTEGYVGEICFFAFNWCPQGFVPANGATLPLQQNVALYSLTNNVYGGDGKTNFKVPNLVKTGIIGSGTAADLAANFQWSKPYGSATKTLTMAQMPSHTHAATFAPDQGTPLQGALSLTAKQANATLPIPANGAVLAGLTDTSATPVAKKSYANGTVAGAVVSLGGTSATVTGTGAVTVNAAGAATPIPTSPPVLGLTACIVTQGYYPPRD